MLLWYSGFFLTNEWPAHLNPHNSYCSDLTCSAGWGTIWRDALIDAWTELMYPLADPENSFVPVLPAWEA